MKLSSIIYFSASMPAVLYRFTELFKGIYWSCKNSLPCGAFPDTLFAFNFLCSIVSKTDYEMSFKSCPDEHILLNTQLESSNSHMLTAWRCAFIWLNFKSLFAQFPSCIFVGTVCKCLWVYLCHFFAITLYYLSALSIRSCTFSRVILKVRVMAGRHNFIASTKWKDTF